MFCTLHRWHISQTLDTGEPLPRRVSRHLERCPECSAFYERCETVAAELAEQARPESATVSAKVHAGILRRCTRRPAGAGTPARRVHARVWAVAAALIVLAVLIGQLVFSGSPEKSTPPQSATTARGEFTWPDTNVVEAAAAVEMAAQRPLTDELRLLTQDGKAAAGFLLACMPVEMKLPEEDERP